MKQVWIRKTGSPQVLHLQETTAPIPGNGEVRIKVAAIGVNFADLLGRIGVYPDAPATPYVPGYEVSGVVDAVGQGVTSLHEGDRVFALTRFGGYSTAVCVPHKQVFKAYDWMSDYDAAAIPVSYLTAYMALVVLGALRKDDTVLIHGVGGGVGLAALDICRIMGAHTIGTASAGKHAFLQERGLDTAVDYRHPDRDYERDVQELTNGRGVNLILDSLGGHHWQKNYRLLTPLGRLIVLGASSMVPSHKRSLFAIVRGYLSQPRFTPLQLMSDNKGVLGLNIGHLWDQKDALRDYMAQIVTWYDAAEFRPHIDQVFKLADAAEAHTYVQERQNMGKVLLVP
ncbi:MAG: zinc-binding dehydrogenase [Anaerolineales bacterium]|nr:zinc-binding dehydrogenase [Anaerolineales bacterium]